MTIEIPSISYHMLLDAMRPCKIISEPSRQPAKIRWVSSLNWKQVFIPLREMAFVCSSSEMREASLSFPESLLIVISREEAPAEYEAVSNPIIVVNDSPSASGLLERIQSYLLSIQSWNNEIARISPSPKALKTALDISGRLISAPLLLYGRDNQAISRSLFNIRNPLCKAFLGRESEIVNSVRMLHRPSVSFKEGKGAIVVENALLGSERSDQLLLLALFESQPSPGQRDTLRMLVELLESRPDLQTRKMKERQVTPYELFDNLANGKYVSKGQLNDYATSLRIPLDAEFRLFGFIQDKSSEQKPSINDLALSLRKVNRGKNLTVVYDDRLYLLLYSKGFDNSLANKVVEDQLSPLVEQTSGFFAVSQVFDEITNLKFAYQQVDVVAKHKTHIDLSSWFTMAGQENRRLCYTFEETLRFLLVDPEGMSPELRDFSFSHTILDKIIKEDAENGCDDARMLASYIHHERKATVVAEKLHVHRNTVLYRIGKIADRFGLDFNESWTRERVLFDFSILYSKLIHDPELFKKVTGLDRPPSIPTSPHEPGKTIKG